MLLLEPDALLTNRTENETEEQQEHREEHENFKSKLFPPYKTNRSET
jgi:hypothetical protein